MINDMRRDFLNQFVYVYLDNILIYLPDLDPHRDHVTTDLKQLLENKLYVEVAKNEFHASTISFLSFIVACGRMQIELAKISAVPEWPTPDSCKKASRIC